MFDSVPCCHFCTHDLFLSLLDRRLYEHPSDGRADARPAMFNVFVTQGCVIVGSGGGGGSSAWRPTSGSRSPHSCLNLVEEPVVD